MADEIYLKTGDLSSGILRKVISKAEHAKKRARTAEDEAHWGHSWAWGGNTYLLYSTNSEWLIADAESKISNAKAKLEKLATILNSDPDAMEEIDRKYKSDLKAWRKSGNHDEILWIVGGGTTAGAISIETSKGKVRRDVSVNPYSEGVSRGNIRYVNQYSAYNSSNGWRQEHWGGMSNSQCNWACESMAFSYLGIDQPPSSMHDSEVLKNFELALGANDGYSASFEAVDGPATVEVHSNGWGASFDRDYLDSLVQNYVNDNGAGSQSPVIMHYSDGSNMHWILLTGKNEDGSYRAIGPWSDPEGTNEQLGFNVTISDNGIASGSGFSGCNGGRRVDCIGQYTRTS